MKKNLFIFSFLIVCMSFALIVGPGCGGSQADDKSVRLSKPAGQVEARTTPSTDFIAAGDKQIIQKGGAVRTGRDSSVGLNFPDESFVMIKADAFFEYEGENPLAIQNQGLVIYRFKQQKQGVKIKTPHGVTTVLGTIFLLDVSASGTTLIVNQGSVSFAVPGGDEIKVEEGNRLIAEANGKCSPAHLVDPLLRETLFQGIRMEDASINR